jgi:predicted CoA-substrate-specific enzyme activase
MTPASPSPLWHVGCDVGSTAVKLIVQAPFGGAIRARRYERHGTRQTQAVVRLLQSLAADDPGLLAQACIFWTGSGGRTLAENLGCRYLQEVNAVAVATEERFPEAGSVVDLGGQDAKIIVWQRDAATGRRRKLFSMNDKCAGGTGSVIDRIASKLGLTGEGLQRAPAPGGRIHPIAARCGVFAETDINGLQKQGVPPEELLASLFAAIVQQNLSVLTRGATLQAPVLLLGGPHAYLPGLVARWREALASLWRERGIAYGDIQAAVRVPPDACYFAAFGAILHGESAPFEDRAGEPRGEEILARLTARLAAPVEERGAAGLLHTLEERAALEELARQAPRPSVNGKPGIALDAVVGLDGGSTSTKAVLLDADGRLIGTSYRLAGGDPLQDARAVLADLDRQVTEAHHQLRVRGLGVTGYAKDMLGALLGADLVLVETVAHTRSALRVRSDVDVIVDVGGQDIKVLTLRDGRVRDFRLNSQCSAGNGYFLQSTAQRFGIPLEDYADHALRAARCPEFHFGCAVFLEADIVNFQQLGWQPGEILAGLARVLPRNVWLYVVGEPNLARLGRVFLLQGGTQRNLAAVKAEFDYIRERVPDAQVIVHPHTGEAGAIGVGLELLDRGAWHGSSRFIGMEALRGLAVHTRQDESTRCRCCANHCSRTILEAVLPEGGGRRYIVASCETGRAAGLQRGSAGPGRAAPDRVPMVEPLRATEPAPDLAAQGQRVLFDVAPQVRVGAARERPRASDRWPWRQARAHARAQRDRIRIGIPRALSHHQVAPFFIAYLQALGVSAERIRVSGATHEELFRRGSRRGAIDTCFPAKVALAHVDDLLRCGEVDCILFPIFVTLPQEGREAIGASACPCAQATPDVIRAACTREGDLFARAGVRYLTPVFHFAERALLEHELRACFGPLLGVGARENRAALEAGEWALARSLAKLRTVALTAIRRLERERRVGIVVLGRPYHEDPGLNHGVFRDLNRRGYTILTAQALPRDAAFLEALFGADIVAGRIAGFEDIRDVWKNSFCANSNQKLWAAKVVARHPNLVGLDVSSFRCGHDAPIHATVEAILETAGTPYFTFHDIDENRPTGAIRLRVETIDYFLREVECRLGRRQPSTEGEWREAALLALADEILV